MIELFNRTLLPNQLVVLQNVYGILQKIDILLELISNVGTPLIRYLIVCNLS